MIFDGADFLHRMHIISPQEDEEMTNFIKIAFVYLYVREYELRSF